MSIVSGCVIAFSSFYFFYLSGGDFSANGSEPRQYPIAATEATSLKASSYAKSNRIASDTMQGASTAPDNPTSDAINDVASTTPTRGWSTTKGSGLGKDMASRPPIEAVNRKTAVRFLYLVQTEDCLPPDLRTNESLGNCSLDFHVLVLSYRQSCDDRSLSHVEYIFNASTTWTTGRNLLFTIAMKRNTAYLYYIFIDDDATAMDMRTNAVAWRAFEGILLSMEPAVMALDLPGQDYSDKVLQTHKDRGCVTEELEYVTGLWFDAMVNAFHYKAVKHLLPYISTFDEQTWWASQMALIVKTEILFRGQLLLHRYIRCKGSQNRPYPRDINFSSHMYGVFTQGLDVPIAVGCVSVCARTMIDQWMKFGNENGWISSTLCLPAPPPHDPVEPCRYQCSLVRDNGAAL